MRPRPIEKAQCQRLTPAAIEPSSRLTQHRPAQVASHWQETLPHTNYAGQTQQKR